MFLKKLAAVLAKIGAVTAEVAVGFPIFKPFLGSGTAANAVVTGVHDLTAVGSTLLQVETVIEGTGQDKMAAAMKLIPQLVATSQLVDGKKIADEALFTKGCQQIAQGVYDVLDSLHPDQVPSPGPGPSPSA